MISASRKACFVLALICAPLFASTNSLVSIPAKVQRFGPLLVVATHEDSPNPETYRSDLFSDKAEERMRLLRAIGIESIPELHELWTAFFHDHVGEDQTKVIAQSISGGMDELNFGEPGSKQVVLYAGYDENTNHPFELRAVFNQKDGNWTRVATVACRCLMYDSAEPFNLHPGRPIPKQEWVITLHRHTEDNSEYHAQEIRFRLRGGILWHLIDFESRSTICPQGSSYGPNCNVVKTDLEPTPLFDEDKSPIPGFVLISWSGKPPDRDMMAMILYHPVCTSYLWNEAVFAYESSSLKPVSCGPVAKPGRKPATGQHSHSPSSHSSLHPQ